MAISVKELERRQAALDKIRDELINDERAPFFSFRKENGFHSVVGEGNLAAHILFVGEAPGATEAKQGHPFCGASGKVLDTLLQHIGLVRADVYITNLVKDRPPKNRDPLPAEVAYYAPLLDRQIKIIKPKVLVTLGRHSMQYLMPKLGLEDELKPIGQMHGKVFKGKLNNQKVCLVTLYHPAVALYNGSMRAVLLKDAEILKKFL